MANKEKKQLKASQKQRRYRAIQYTAFGGEFVSLATPYVIMGAVNFDEWFRTTEGWKIGLGGSLAMALLAIAVLVITKKKDDKDSKTGGYVSLLLSFLAAAFILKLLANIIYEIATIMFFGAIGIAGALGLEVVSKKYKVKADLYSDAIKSVRKESAEEEARKEVYREVEQEVEEEKQKVKVRIVDN